MPADNRFANLEDLFTRALKLPTDQRESFLQDECGGDAQLIHELRSMLQLDEATDDILSQPIVDRAVFERFHTANRATRNRVVKQLIKQFDASPNPDALGRIHIYDILEMVGSGGMGIVFRAIDSRLILFAVNYMH